MTRFAALLRGVNLGGRTLLMADLKRIAAQQGFVDPHTLLASGNLVFASDLAPDAIERRLEEALAAHGLVTDVIVRDHAGLAAAIAANPFSAEAADHPSHLLVSFHRDPFPAAALSRAAALHDGPERMTAVGRELFIDHVGREEMCASKLLSVMKKAKFPTVATARNWNTVVKLAGATA